MATTNLNIRTDKDIKDQAEAIFNELGLNMTTAINMFLRTAIREHGIPFELKLDVPNETTAAESEEGQYGYGDVYGYKYIIFKDVSGHYRFNAVRNIIFLFVIKSMDIPLVLAG